MTGYVPFILATATGTVVIRSRKHGIVEMKVTATVVFDEVTSGPQAWSVINDFGKIRDAAVALVQKTSERDLKGMGDALKQALIDEVIKEDAQKKQPSKKAVMTEQIPPYYKKLVRALVFSLAACISVISFLLFAYSFVNIRSWSLGWLAVKHDGAGLCAMVIDLRCGGMLITIADMGGREPDGFVYDGLNLRGASFEPSIGSDKDLYQPRYPQLYKNRHWRDSSHSFAGFGFAVANDASPPSPSSNSIRTYRGIQFEFALPFPFVVSTALAVIIFPRRNCSAPRFEVIKMQNAKTDLVTAK